MLAVLCIASVFYGGHAVENYGKDFITAFPENIAYYHPSNVTNSLKVTALHDNTHFSITINGSVKTLTLHASQTKVIPLPDGLEEHQLNRSSKSVRITSDNDITVFSFSRRADSTQTNVLLPVDKLGNKYQIPFINFTQPYNFRLLIINAEDKNNNVTISMQQSEQDSSGTDITLSPFEFIQMESNDSLAMVTASANISVLLTHPCLDTYLCKCSMILHQLRPTNLLGDSFIVPPLFSTSPSRIISISDQSVEVKFGSPPQSGFETLDPGSSELPFLQSLKNGFSNITTSQPVSLKLVYRGSLIDLIPVSMFSACYVVQTTSLVKSLALLIVEKLKIQDLRLDSRYIRSQVNWNIINGTKYSWALVDIDPYKAQIMWHPSSKFAVYILETRNSNVFYEGPAMSISEEPDPNGCVTTPASYYVGNQSLSWQASLDYCTNNGSQLASPSWAKAHSAMAQKLKEVGATGQAWIGLRRSLLTLDWYWQNGQTFDFSNWDEDQPIPPEKGMCVSVRMEPKRNYTWSNVRCCSSLKPVCYISPGYMRPDMYV